MEGKRLFGLFLSLVSGASIASGAVLFQMATTVTATQQSFLNGAVAFGFALPDLTVKAAKLRSETLTVTFLFYLTLYGIFGFFASFLSFLSFAYLSSAGDTLAIAGSYLIWTMVLARIFLKEKHNLLEIVLAALTVVGVVLVSRPAFLFGSEKAFQLSTNRTLGVLCAIMASIATAGRIVTSRKLGSLATVSSQMLSTSLVSFVVLPIYWVITESDRMFIPCIQDLGLAVLSSLCIQITSMLCILALRFERSGPVAMAYSLQTFFGYMLDVLVFHLRPSITSIVGAILVLLGTVGPILITVFGNKSSDDYLKKRYRDT